MTTMRDRLIAILEKWKGDIEENAAYAALDRQTGCAGASETLEALLSEMRDMSDELAPIVSGQPRGMPPTQFLESDFVAMIDAIK